MTGMDRHAQLRTYIVKEGRLEAFTALWRDHIVPARRVHGFKVEGAWSNADSGEFTWVISHPEDFGEAERRYYASPERAAIPEDPSDYLASVDVRMVSAVPIPD
jgi:hypothetical protein